MRDWYEYGVGWPEKIATAKETEVNQTLKGQIVQDNPLVGMKGPMTRSKTKKMQEALNQLIWEVHDNIKLIESKKSNESTSVTVLQVETSQSTSPLNFESKKVT